MSTPEGTIKYKLDTKLKERELAGNLWRYSPQAGPFGRSGIPDRLVLCNGYLIGIECKADASKKPTPLQEKAMADIQASGGTCFVVFDAATIDAVIAHIDSLIAHARH